MIVREFFKIRIDKVRLFRTSSDSDKTIIRNDGVEYDEAIDVEDAPYTYTESDHTAEPMPDGPEEP